MALVPTSKPSVDSEGLLKGLGVKVNGSVQAMHKNEPIFGIGNQNLQGYVALKMYEQHTADVIDQSVADSGERVLQEGQSYSSGKPYITHNKVWIDDIVRAT